MLELYKFEDNHWKNKMNITVKLAIDIFKLQTDSDFLINKFAECSNVDKTQINKPALISKLHRYKEKLKGKRGKQKEEFENEVFSIPVATSTAAASKGKLYEDELYSYKETCSTLATELSEIQKKSIEKFESIKSEHAIITKENETKHKRELLSLKKSQSEELRSQTKKLRLETKRVSQKATKVYNENEKIEKKLTVVKKSKQYLSHENSLLRRKLARNSIVKETQKQKNLKKTLISETNKVSKCLHEIEVLKQNNSKLVFQLQKEQKTVLELSEKLKLLDQPDPLNKLRVDLQTVTEERDYLHTLLLDHEEIVLFDPVKKSYTPDTRQCIINMTSYNVSSNNVGPVINEVLKLANRTPNAIPTRKTVDNIIVEKIAVDQKQLGLTVGAQQDTCLYGDETRKFGKTYQTFLMSDENKQVYFLGLRDMHDKAASTTLDMFTNILDDISDICETYRNNNITSHGHSILSNIRNFMSDSAQTNIAFTELLQNYRTEIMPTFLQNWNELTLGEQTSTVIVNIFLLWPPFISQLCRMSVTYTFTI